MSPPSLLPSGAIVKGRSSSFSMSSTHLLSTSLRLFLLPLHLSLCVRLQKSYSLSMLRGLRPPPGLLLLAGRTPPNPISSPCRFAHPKRHTHPPPRTPAPSTPPPPLTNDPPQALACYGPERPPVPGLVGNEPCLEGRFLGYDTFLFGFIHHYPLANLPKLPLIIPAALVLAPVVATQTHTPVLALTWHPELAVECTTIQHNNSPTLAPLASRGRRIRRNKNALVDTRQSSRLAGKDPLVYTSMSTKATMFKALRNVLASCSAALQQQVTKRGVLKKSKLPLPAADLRKLAAATLGGNAQSELNKVLHATNASPSLGVLISPNGM